MCVYFICPHELRHKTTSETSFSLTLCNDTVSEEQLLYPPSKGGPDPLTWKGLGDSQVKAAAPEKAKQPEQRVEKRK